MNKNFLLVMASVLIPLQAQSSDSDFKKQAAYAAGTVATIAAATFADHYLRGNAVTTESAGDGDTEKNLTRKNASLSLLEIGASGLSSVEEGGGREESGERKGGSRSRSVSPKTERMNNFERRLASLEAEKIEKSDSGRVSPKTQRIMNLEAEVEALKALQPVARKQSSRFFGSRKSVKESESQAPVDLGNGQDPSSNVEVDRTSISNPRRDSMWKTDKEKGREGGVDALRRLSSGSENDAITSAAAAALATTSNGQKDQKSADL